MSKGTEMNKLLFVIVSGALACSSFPSIAAEDMKCGHGMTQMKNMDTDNDGTVSKEEFMKSHEAMWDGMKKNKDGLVDVKEMQMMRKGTKKDKDVK
jgi:EF hand